MIANFMSQYPEVAMVRRFRALNARHLLYLQAELAQIEKQLLKQEEIDAKERGHPDKPKYAIDYAWLMDSAEEEDHAQWQLIKDMKEKLKEYNEVLIQQTTLAQISSPSKHDAEIMREWYLRKDRADLGGRPLIGDDRSTWGDIETSEDGTEIHTSKHSSDLIAINGSSSDYDEATFWLANKFIPNWHEKFWSRRHAGIQAYPQSYLYRFTSVVATLLSSLLPVVSIVVLYLVHSMPARLGIIAAFTAGFSVVLSIITSASRIDNFAATAAFAAVQVVFVGTSGNATSTG